jgi:branched-chain amino acid transport system substrate-binding protein
MFRLIKSVLVLALATAPVVVFAEEEPIKLINLLELSGAIASAGTNYRDGVNLAVKEINASGGVLGRKFEVTTLDTQSSPGIAKALAQKAIDMDAFAVIGPISSGSMIVSANETRRAEIPNFTGAAAAAITQQGNPYVIRTATTQAATMPKLARYIRDGLKARTIDIIYINSDFGKGGHDEFVRAATALGMKIGTDTSTEQGQVDFSGPVLMAKQSSGDVLFVYTNEDESARLARELRKQGYGKPIVGETTLVSRKVIELAGDAANGLLGHLSMTVDAPSQALHAFDQRFTKEYRYKSDHNGIQGYMVPYMIKAISEKLGKVDRKAFAAAIKDTPIYVRDTPGILIDTKFDANGDPDRVSYIAEVKDGKQVIIATLPPIRPF